MRTSFFLTAFVSVLLVGCLDNTQEITIREDGGGIFSASSDMSQLLGLVRQMGMGQDLSQLDNQKMDTVVSLASAADSLPGLTDAERLLVTKASLSVTMNFGDDLMKAGIRIPFDNAEQAAILEPISGKLLGDVARRQVGDKLPVGGRQMPSPSSFEEYYDLTMTPGSIRRTINTQRYAKATDDEFLKGMRELAGMGLSMKSTYVINLPRPATKVEGKAVKLSEDKRKVTITADIDDFFDEPEKLQYLVEY